MWKSVIAPGLLALTVLQGCGSNKPVPLDSAVYAAFETETRLRVWVDRCSAVSVAAEKAGNETFTRWWHRNGELMNAADFGLAYQLVTVTERRGENGARVAMAVTQDVSQQALLWVEDALDSAAQPEVACMEAFAAYNAEKFDLVNNDALAPTLTDLASKQQTIPRESLQQARGQATAAGYGRSFLVVEKYAEQLGCDGPSVLLLKNKPPRELYTADCADGSEKVFRCEWGNCVEID